jgi:hypothetical protein
MAEQGEKGRKSGIYTVVNEHFEFLSNAVMSSAVAFQYSEGIGTGNLVYFKVKHVFGDFYHRQTCAIGLSCAFQPPIQGARHEMQ